MDLYVSIREQSQHASCPYNGTIFTIDGNLVVGINPTTGETFSVAMENSTSSGTGQCFNVCSSPLPSGQSEPNNSYNTPPTTGSLMIAGDGYAYVPYMFGVSTGNSKSVCAPGCGCYSSYSSTQSLHLMRVGPTGDSYEISLGDFSSAGWDQNCWSGTAGSSNSATPTLITNADQCVLASYSVTYNTDYGSVTYTNSGPVYGSSGSSNTTSFYLASTSGPSLASNSQVAIISGQTSPVQPILQRQDGNFIGTVSSSVGSFMVGFTPSGGTLFTVPNDTPQVATADNGVIGASRTTYDQNGNVTGQLASMPTQSWLGNSYMLGSVDQVAATPVIAGSLWSWQGGNPAGTATSSRPWFFILIWQNDFTFTPYDPNLLPSLTTDITSSASIIKAAALKALHDAYSGVPVTVVEGTHGGDNRATVLDTVPISSDCGDTNPNQGGLTAGFHDSEVNYDVNMEQAQTALNISITNAQTEAAALQQTALMDAIGMGIGNTAAHEIAHQFLKHCCSMDANPSTDPNAKGTYNATGCTAAADPTPWTGYWPGPPKIYIHWEAPTLTGLTQCLANGWQNYGVSQCYK
jgi:hypothetical protein